jgi:hypothetical protein
MRSFSSVRGALLAAVLVGVTGCTVYQVAPGTPVAMPSVFDRSSSAAVGAMQDQGVQIDVEDRAGGVIRGRRCGIDVAASVRTQADGSGSVRVQFDSSGATAQDPTLLHRISSADDRRMGR